MELIKAIAILCNMGFTPAAQLHCNKFFHKCVGDETTQILEDYRVGGEDAEAIALKRCIKTSSIGFITKYMGT